MKIALFNWRCRSHPASGGAEVFTESIVQRWVDQGHEPTLFSAAYPGSEAVTEAAGVRHIRSGNRYTVYRHAQRWWREQGADARFDLVIDEINTRPFACHRWVKNTPTVALMHQLAQEVWFYETPLPVAVVGRYMLEPRWLRSLRHTPVMTISRSSRQSFLDAGLQRVVLIPVGIDDAPLSAPAIKSSRPTVVFVGRMASNKRPQDAVKAVELALPFVPGLQIHLIGEGAQRSQLAARGDHVVAHGYLDRHSKDEIVRQAHAQVVTSVREGWGLVVDEAARLGTPSIAYDVAGLRDSVSEAKGWTVEPRPEAMAEALVRHLPDLAAAPPELGWAGGAKEWSTVADETLATAIRYAEICHA